MSSAKWWSPMERSTSGEEEEGDTKRALATSDVISLGSGSGAKNGLPRPHMYVRLAEVGREAGEDVEDAGIEDV